MDNSKIFSFNTDISNIEIPSELNNPFAAMIPPIAKIAARAFQKYIQLESQKWTYDFSIQKGKMFGVLVVQKVDNTLGYLGTISGRLDRQTICPRFAPSIFDDATDDYFINKGMTALTEIGKQINQSKVAEEIQSLKELRKQKSTALQKWLFENYLFQNIKGKQQNALQVFEQTAKGYPPAAAGECAAPKLLQYAFQHQLRPIALAEFWWGLTPKSKEKEHLSYYPACKDKCKPILAYMLDDPDLYDRAQIQ